MKASIAAVLFSAIGLVRLAAALWHGEGVDSESAFAGLLVVLAPVVAGWEIATRRRVAR